MEFKTDHSRHNLLDHIVCFALQLRAIPTLLPRILRCRAWVSSALPTYREATLSIIPFGWRRKPPAIWQLIGKRLVGTWSISRSRTIGRRRAEYRASEGLGDDLRLAANGGGLRLLTQLPANPHGHRGSSCGPEAPAFAAIDCENPRTSGSIAGLGTKSLLPGTQQTTAHQSAASPHRHRLTVAASANIAPKMTAPRHRSRVRGD